MKKKVTSILCCLLAAALLVTGLPLTVSAAEERIEVSGSSAPLREGPGKSYAVIATLSKGDCLTVTGSTVNQYGNTWYQVQYGTETAYIYDGNVQIHTHDYRKVNDSLAICKCGSYKSSRSGQVEQMSYGAGELLGSDFWKALAAMEAAKAVLASGGSSVAGAMATVGPYVAVAVVGGVLIYILLSNSGAQITNVTTVSTQEDIDALLKTSVHGKPYYKAAIVPGTGMLLLEKNGMGIKEAREYITDLSKDITSALIASTTNLVAPMYNVWCKDFNTANKLCEEIRKYGNSCFLYGDDSAPNMLSDCDKTVTKINGGITYEHFHVYSRLETTRFTKVCKVHILFGGPIDISAVLALG